MTTYYEPGVDPFAQHRLVKIPHDAKYIKLRLSAYTGRIPGGNGEFKDARWVEPSLVVSNEDPDVKTGIRVFGGARVYHDSANLDFSDVEIFKLRCYIVKLFKEYQKWIDIFDIEEFDSKDFYKWKFVEEL